MLVVSALEPFAKEISNVSEYDENKVGKVCRNEIIVWWVVLNGFLDRFTLGVFADVEMTRVGQWTELSVSSSYSVGFFGRRGAEEHLLRVCACVRHRNGW